MLITIELPDALQISETDLRTELAVSLFQQERITLGTASQLAGLSQIEFQHLRIANLLTCNSWRRGMAFGQKLLPLFQNPLPNAAPVQGVAVFPGYLIQDPYFQSWNLCSLTGLPKNFYSSR